MLFRSRLPSSRGGRSRPLSSSAQAGPLHRPPSREETPGASRFGSEQGLQAVRSGKVDLVRVTLDSPRPRWGEVDLGLGSSHPSSVWCCSGVLAPDASLKGHFSPKYVLAVC